VCSSDLALKSEVVADLGAYLSSNASIIPTNACAYVLGGCYDIRSVYLGVRGAFTNTAPVDAYRGAGRPEAAYMIERLVELAAKRLGIDSFELRRRNFIQPGDMPYKTAVGMTLDCGAFADNLSRALKLADHEGFGVRRRDAASAGKRRGFGVACYFEATLGMPTEGADIRFRKDGKVALLIGTQSNGQGHETSFAQILADRLGLPIDRIEVVQGDTDAIPTGGGHGGSRSLQIGGSAIWRAADLVISKARRLAAHTLEAAEADIEFTDGACRVAGTDRAIALLDLAQIARDPARLPDGMTPGLDERGDYTREAFTFPNGVHACEVEVDTATGKVAIVGYAVVDDFGRVINPALVAGQVHGGVVQGLGQALLERTVYDDQGQLLTGSFMDYCMPRADDLPEIRFELNEDVPATTNPLGVKGCGEAGCIGALPAAINALCDALDVDHIDMPATPELVWRVANRKR
jgi:carbon-monoxide dehydrogenase large subunit